jgi:hypothetical protein
MKANYLKVVMAVVALGGTTLSAPLVLAQDASAIAATNASAPAVAPTASVPPTLAYGVSQILQLAQAKVSDDTIIAYVKNSGNSYGLSADQIIYLQKQGLSSAVITAMLNQPRPGALASPSAPTPALTATEVSGPAPAVPVAPDNTPSATSTATVAPTVSYVETQPAPVYYYPYYYSYGNPCYYPAYGFYPGVAVSFGWGRGWGGWHGGGGFRGGWRR